MLLDSHDRTARRLVHRWPFACFLNDGFYPCTLLLQCEVHTQNAPRVAGSFFIVSVSTASDDTICLGCFTRFALKQFSKWLLLLLYRPTGRRQSSNTVCSVRHGSCMNPEPWAWNCVIVEMPRTCSQRWDYVIQQFGNECECDERQCGSIFLFLTF